MLKQGFTMLELLVVLSIIGLLATIGIPSYLSSAEKTKAQMAKNNLMAIAAAQQKYSEDYNGAYCINSGASPTCGDNLVDLSSNLHLGMSTNDQFSYSCFTPGAAEVINYNCTASDGGVTLTLDPNTGSVSCAGPANNCPS